VGKGRGREYKKGRDGGRGGPPYGEKKEGGNKSRLWIPACAGMTKTLIGRKAKSPSIPLYQRGRRKKATYKRARG
jgi:hypothetical protein